MDDKIEEKIKTYCKKINMKMDNISVMPSDDGYIATDGYTSIMFDKEGVVSSLPMYKLYGAKTTKVIGNGAAIFMYIVIVMAFLIVIISSLLK